MASEIHNVGIGIKPVIQDELESKAVLAVGRTTVDFFKANRFGVDLVETDYVEFKRYPDVPGGFCREIATYSVDDDKWSAVSEHYEDHPTQLILMHEFWHEGSTPEEIVCFLDRDYAKQKERSSPAALHPA